MAEHTHTVYKCRLMGWDQWLWYRVFIMGEIMYVGGPGSYGKATPSAWFCCSKNKVYFLKNYFPLPLEYFTLLHHFFISLFEFPFFIFQKWQGSLCLVFLHKTRARLSMPGISPQSHSLSHFPLAYCKGNSFKAQSRGLTAHTQTSMCKSSGGLRLSMIPADLFYLCLLSSLFAEALGAGVRLGDTQLSSMCSDSCLSLDQSHSLPSPQNLPLSIKILWFQIHRSWHPSSISHHGSHCSAEPKSQLSLLRHIFCSLSSSGFPGLAPRQLTGFLLTRMTVHGDAEPGRTEHTDTLYDSGGPSGSC